MRTLLLDMASGARIATGWLLSIGGAFVRLLDEVDAPIDWDY